jgi:DNA-binding NtrC family response regulator
VNNQTVLVVDDEPDIRGIVSEILEDEGYKVDSAGDGSEAREKFNRLSPDLVLLDIWMPDTDGITLLTEWCAQSSNRPPVIMISGHGTVETAVDALRLGAYDFLEKPLSTAKLLVTVAELVGHSPNIQELKQQIDQIAPGESWVLVRGEPGSGKGVVVRALHRASRRKEQAFIEVNLASIPGENIAIELFGYEDGDSIQTGRFEQAHGGTLVLDEIGDLDLEIQAKLLSALEERRFYRIGGRTRVEFDVRIFSTSNQDIESKTRQGTFREDLFYRLNAVPIDVPALRNHREDIPDLISYYTNQILESENLSFHRFSTAAVNYLRNRPWPGNIRELRNFIHRMLITSNTEEIDADETRETMGSAATPVSTDMVAQVVPDFDQPLREAREQFERDYFNYHLVKTNGNMTALAQRCSMERTHLYRKLKGLGINPKSVKNRA